MKKVVFIAIALLGMQLSAQAQETPETPAPPKEQSTVIHRNDPVSVYVGFGASFLGDYKMNDRLKAAGLPEIASVAPEVTVGLNVAPDHSDFLMDVELSTAYMDDKTATDRIKSTLLSTRLRVQYKLVDTDALYLAGGLDLGYAQTLINVYSRSNVIDLNDLDTSSSGVLSMRSGQLITGPSVALLMFRNKSLPVRLSTGYNIGITNGKWKSDFAQVNNTVKEMGLGSFYARLSIGF